MRLAAILLFGIGSFWPFLTGCANTTSKCYSISYDEEGNKLVIYQLLPRLFGNTVSRNVCYGTIEENGVGKFNDISAKALSELRLLGVTHVWYTGIIEHAVIADYSSYGILPDDPDVIKGRAGSPYAIKDYYDVNPDLAVDKSRRMEEFEQLVERTHRAGLKAIIDFVPNHVARFYHSDNKPDSITDLGADDDTKVTYATDNNFYYLPGTSFSVPPNHRPLGERTFPGLDGVFNEEPAKASGNDRFVASPSVDDWFETAKLNYGVNYQTDRTFFEPQPNTWKKMHDILYFWASKGIDGFRCDMAEMVPVAFWQWCIPQLKDAFPHLIFIAEIYNPDLYSAYLNKADFDFLYDKVQLYDSLKSIVKNRQGVRVIDSVMQAQRDWHGQLLRFLENHDEQRIAHPDFAGNAQWGIPAFTLSACIDTGPVLLYFGQEVGEKGLGAEGFGGNDGRTTIFDYWGVPAHQAWMNDGIFDGGLLTEEQRHLRIQYQQLLQFISNAPAIQKGSFLSCHELTPEGVFRFFRLHSSQSLIVLCNFNDEEIRCTLSIPDQIQNSLKEREGKITLFPTLQLCQEPEAYEIESLNAHDTVTLPPLSATIFEISYGNETN